MVSPLLLTYLHSTRLLHCTSPPCLPSSISSPSLYFLLTSLSPFHFLPSLSLLFRFLWYLFLLLLTNLLLCNLSSPNLYSLTVSPSLLLTYLYAIFPSYLSPIMVSPRLLLISILLPCLTDSLHPSPLPSPLPLHSPIPVLPQSLTCFLPLIPASLTLIYLPPRDS